MSIADETETTFTESAARAIAFSKYEAAKAASDRVELEHLLVGILREREPRLEELARTHGVSIDAIRREVDVFKTTSIGGAQQLPFSTAVQEVIRSAAAGHDTANRATSVDLLRAILQAPPSRAREVLANGGLSLHVLESQP